MLDVPHLKIFGYKAYAHIRDENWNKLKFVSIACVFLIMKDQAISLDVYNFFLKPLRIKTLCSLKEQIR